MCVCVCTCTVSVLRVIGADEVQRDVGSPGDVIVRESPARPFVAATHDTLTHKAHSTQHEHRQDDPDHRSDGVGVTLITTGW